MQQHTGPQTDGESTLERALLEQWPGAAIVLDRSFEVRWLNRRAARWLGSGTESMVARPWHELPLPWKIDRSLLEEVLHGTEKRLSPPGLVDVDGNPRSCAARLLPLQLEGGASAVLMVIDDAPADLDPDTDPQRLRRRGLALAVAQVGFWEWDFQSGEASVDAEWCRLLLLDPCPGPGHRDAWVRNIHPDDQPEFRRRMEALNDGAAGQIEIEYRVLTSDYRWVWILQRGRIVERGTDGVPRCASGICLEIDERKRHEVNLRESESRLANALWGARASLWHWHIPARTLVPSPMWYAMTGYSEEEWRSVRNPWLSRVHPEDRQRVIAGTRAHLEGRTQALEHEYRIRTATGAWRWVLDRGRIVEWDLDGSPTVAIGVSLDIHAQKEAELRLRKSEAHLETAVWGAGMGLWEMDVVSGRVKWFSDWCDRLDLDPCMDADRISGWGASIHPEDAQDVARRIAAHLAGEGDGYDVEYRMRTRQGGWLWLFERGRVIERCDDGVAVRMVGVCMDIQARKRAEFAAFEAQQRLRSAFKGLRATVWEWDRDRGADPFSSDIYRRMLGCDVAQGGEGVWCSYVHPEDIESYRTTARKVWDSGPADTYQLQYRVRYADGSWRWLFDRTRVLERDQMGKARSAVGFLVDITDHKRTEAALIESERRFRLATEAVRGMIYEADLSTGTVERYGLERLTGYGPGELSAAADAWFDLFHPEDRQKGRASYDTQFRAGDTAVARYRVRHRDGRYIHVWDRAVAARREPSGRVTRTVGFVMDVTELVETQEALRKSEVFHRSVLALSSGFGFELCIDQSDRVALVSVTEGYEQVFGCTLEEFERRGGWDACVDRESICPTLRRENLRGGVTLFGDVRIRTPGGDWKWLAVKAQPIRDRATGLVTGAVGSAIDITERKLAEEQLRHSQSVLQTISDSSPSWLLLVDCELRYVFINRPAGGMAPEQLIGQPLGILEAESSQLRLRAVARSVIESGESAVYVHASKSRLGERRYYDCRVAAVRAGDHIIGAVLNIADITDRRRAEDSLRVQARILETMDEGVVLVDANDFVRLTNPAFDQMFGYAAGEILGCSIAPLFQLNGTRRASIERRRREPHERDTPPLEIECLRRNGTRFVAACVITPLDVDGDVHWLAVVTDATDQKRLQREIVETTNREQRRIGSDLHDGLGQDLTGIALMLCGVEAQLRAEHPVLCRDVEDVIRLVNGAIESTRNIVSGLSPVSASRGGLVTALRSLVNRSSARFGVKIGFTSQLRVPLEIDENAATQFYRIAQEAITNAVRHGHATDIDIDLEVDEDWIHLCIRDNGRGFDPAERSASGMGLKIMQYRSQLLRGDLVVHGTPERGVEVCCICPHGSAPGVEEGIRLRLVH